MFKKICDKDVSKDGEKGYSKEVLERAKKLYENELPLYKPRSGQRVDISEKNRFDEVDGVKVAKKKGKPGTATIMCCGDMLCEDLMYTACVYGDSYSFHSVFRYVARMFKHSDLVIGNLETMITDTAPYTGQQYKIGGKYHNNAPIEFLDAIKNSGIDFCVLANNHGLDCGIQGIYDTINNLEEYNMMHTGLFLTEEEKRYELIEINGIKVAVLAYSSWFNRNFDRLTQKGREVVINEYKKEKMEKDVADAKADGAEYVMVWMHWGIDVEYYHESGQGQKKLAQEVADAGADIVVGSHTHSVQEISYVKSKDGKEVPVIYSLGNFATSERNMKSRQTMVVTLNLRRQYAGVKTEISYMPCKVLRSYGGQSYAIVPAATEFNGSSEMSRDMKENLDLVSRVVGSYAQLDKIEKPRKGKGPEKSEKSEKLAEAYSLSTILEVTGGKPFGWTEDEIKTVKFSEITYGENAVKDSLSLASAFSSNADLVPGEETAEKYAKMAVEKGAKGIITTKPREGYKGIVVEKPLYAFVQIIANIRKQFPDAKTVCITGSIGKTTTTQMMYSVLEGHFNTHRSTGSANNFRYTGKNVQKLEAKHTAYVQETQEGPPYMCAKYLSLMTQPDVAIITRVASSHMEDFGSIDRIRESCVAISEGMGPNGILIMNADDPEQMKAKVNVKKLTYGIDAKDADFRATNIEETIEGIKFNVQYATKSVPVKLNMLGIHNVHNALAVFAAGKQYGLSDEKIVAGLGKYKTSGIRQNLVKINGVYYYLDCYNSAYESIESSIKSIDALKGNNKRIAVLGDVMSIGEDSPKYHEKIGEFLASRHMDMIFFYGNEMKYAYDKYIEITGDESKAWWTADEDQLVAKMKSDIKKGDLVFVKGSHGMKLELVMDRVCGTYYHEEFLVWDFIAKNVENDKMRYTNYVDHITINKIKTDEKDLVIPDKLDGIVVTGLNRAVSNRKANLETLVIPEGVRNMRNSCFFKCEKLKKVTLPASLDRMEDYSFGRCTALEEIEIPEGVYHIGDKVFLGCKSLKKLRLPRSIEEIGFAIFSETNGLTLEVYKGSAAEKYFSNPQNIPMCGLNVVVIE